MTLVDHAAPVVATVDWSDEWGINDPNRDHCQFAAMEAIGVPWRINAMSWAPAAQVEAAIFGPDTRQTGGDDYRFEMTVLVTPLPPPGPVQVAIAWPRFDLEHTATTIDGRAVLTAASRTVVLWPPTGDMLG